MSLKDRASFLEDQKALHAAWKAEMQTLIEGQNGALQQVVMQTAALLRAQAPTAGAALADPIPIQIHAPASSKPTGAWGWIWAGVLLGTGATVAVALATVVWRPFAG